LSVDEGRLGRERYTGVSAGIRFCDTSTILASRKAFPSGSTLR
jgi:hypothetical protein